MVFAMDEMEATGGKGLNPGGPGRDAGSPAPAVIEAAARRKKRSFLPDSGLTDALLKVPPYRRRIMAGQAVTWMRWQRAVDNLTDASAGERFAYLQVFAAERGLEVDSKSAAAAGITKRALKGFIDGGRLPDLKRGTLPGDLGPERMARVYRAFTDDALWLAGGHAALRRLADHEAAALLDTLVGQGASTGTRLIQMAINAIRWRFVGEDSILSLDVFEVFRKLTEGTERQALLDALADRRRKFKTRRRDLDSERIEHFRFRGTEAKEGTK